MFHGTPGGFRGSQKRFGEFHAALDLSSTSDGLTGYLNVSRVFLKVLCEVSGGL